MLVLLVLAVAAGSTSALLCETCDGERCAEFDKWVTENCMPEARFCYRFADAADNVFRRGCTAYNCSTMPGVPIGATCNVCDSDKCNGRKPIAEYGSGGGDVWSAATAPGSCSLLLSVGALFTTAALLARE